MLKIDREEETYEIDGDTIDIISDISYAIFCVVNHIVSDGMSRVNWDDALDSTLDGIKTAIKKVHEEVQNGTFG